VLDLLPSDHPLARVRVGGPDGPHSRLAGEDALDAFLAADILVIGAPMYNFTVPTQLKAWLDRIFIPWLLCSPSSGPRPGSSSRAACSMRLSSAR
jgi:NAD(P)H-dependent FMN reductase